MSRVWLIGENNPYSTAPKYALYPAPERSAGYRLCRGLGLSRPEYLRTFERRDLLRELKWSVPKARAAASKLLTELGAGDALVLLGGKVTAAFGLTFEPLMVQQTSTGHTALVSAHPSGLSRVWNQPGYEPKIREAVMKLVEERREKVAA